MKIPQINKAYLPILAAIVIAIVSTFALKNIFDKRIEAATVVEKSSYVVATVDLQKDTVITADTFSAREIPVKWAHSDAVVISDFESVVGKKITIDLKRGETLLHNVIEGEKVKNITQLISVGRRALTIPVDDESSISSMLKPGDIIDLILTMQKNSKVRTMPLMEGVKILATGNNLDDSNLLAEQYGSSSRYNTITLDVSIEDSQNIIRASNLGKITAVLRNPEDQTFSAARNIVLEQKQKKQVPKATQNQGMSEKEINKMLENMYAGLLKELGGDVKQKDPKPVKEKKQIVKKTENKPTVNLIYGNS